jgi:hypothetical protein
MLARTSPRRTLSFIPRGQFRRNHRSRRKQNVMVIDKPQPRRDGLAVLKILRPQGNVSLWGQRNVAFGTDIFARICEAYKKIHTDQDYTISPTCAWCVKCISCEHVSQNVFWILKIVDCIVLMLSFILWRKLCFKNTVFRDWRSVVWWNIDSGGTLLPLLGCKGRAQRTAVIYLKLDYSLYFPNPLYSL